MTQSSTQQGDVIQNMVTQDSIVNRMQQDDRDYFVFFNIWCSSWVICGFFV